MIRHICLIASGAALMTMFGCRMASTATTGDGGLVRDPDHQFAQPVDSWKSIREENVVMQKYDYSCGAAALATIAKYHFGDKISEEDVVKDIIEHLSEEEFKDRQRKGLSMTDLRLSAVRLGYLASLGKQSIDKLPNLKIPIIVRIVHEQYEHFVVVRGVVGDRVFLADPIRGNIRLSIQEFGQQWEDRVLLVMVKPDVKPPESSPLLIEPHAPVQPELQAARRSLFLQH